jgi:hypothetical protein
METERDMGTERDREKNEIDGEREGGERIIKRDNEIKRDRIRQRHQRDRTKEREREGNRKTLIHRTVEKEKNYF